MKGGSTLTVIYADLIFGLNIILDWTLLRTTAWMRGFSFSKWKVAAATGVGTAYAAVLFIPSYPILYTYVGKILFSIVMLLIAFGFRNIGFFVKTFATFYFSAFVLAGGAIGLQYLFQDARGWSLFREAREMWKSGGADLQMGAGFLVVALLASYALFRTVWKQGKRQQQVARQLVQVDIQIGEIKRSCTGLVDTGNHLNDPLSGAPVIITESCLWEGALPGEWLARLKQEQPLDMLQSIGDSDGKCPFDESRLRIIPYRGVNQGMQWMIGLKPDFIQVTSDTEKYVCTKVIIGLDGGTLSHEGAFQAIIHPGVMESAAAASFSLHSETPEAATRAS